MPITRDQTNVMYSVPGATARVYAVLSSRTLIIIIYKYIFIYIVASGDVYELREKRGGGMYPTQTCLYVEDGFALLNATAAVACFDIHGLYGNGGGQGYTVLLL